MPKIIKSLKADPNKHQRTSDGLGLYLFIHKNGYKYWKFDYSRPYTKSAIPLVFKLLFMKLNQRIFLRFFRFMKSKKTRGSPKAQSKILEEVLDFPIGLIEQ